MAADAPIAQLLVHAKHTDQAASQGRRLGWIAAVAGVINLAMLAVLVLKLSRGASQASDFAQERSFRAIRQRQNMLGKSVAQLNAHFESTDGDHKQLLGLLQTINEQLRATEVEIDKAAAQSVPVSD
jgi:hypothetical protein